MTKKEAYSKLSMRYKELSQKEWADFVDLIENDIGEFKKKFREWEKRKVTTSIHQK